MNERSSAENFLNAKLVDEYIHGGFIIRYHTYDANLGKHHIVCFNPRDGDLLQIEGGLTLQEKMVGLITENDLNKIHGRKVYQPVRLGLCMFGFNEPVISLHDSDEANVGLLKRLAEKVIDRYENKKI